MKAVRRGKPRKLRKPVDLNRCGLCLGTQKDEELYGKFFQNEKEKLAVHQFCLFFGCGLAQNGEDNEGFDGFLFDDIREEIVRASKLMCTLCHKKGASIGCSVPKCRSAFHFSCGLERRVLFQFFGSFCAFCKYHRPTQQKYIHQSSQSCPICLCDIDHVDGIDSLSSPCCKNALFHRTCVQKQALSSGLHFFRCAFCNNFETFQQEMNRMGIYIPERDAAWEQGDAYADLLQSYNKCDSSNCLCPNGREFTGEHEGEEWEICLCYTCGQSGTHLQCKGWKLPLPKWLCSDCELISLNNSIERMKSLNGTPTKSGGQSLDQTVTSTNCDGTHIYVESSSDTSSIVEYIGYCNVKDNDLVLTSPGNTPVNMSGPSIPTPGNDSDRILEASDVAQSNTKSSCPMVESECSNSTIVSPVVFKDNKYDDQEEVSSLTSESTILLEDPQNLLTDSSENAIFLKKGPSFSLDEDTLRIQNDNAAVSSLSKQKEDLPPSRRRFVLSYLSQTNMANKMDDKKCCNEILKQRPEDDNKPNSLESQVKVEDTLLTESAQCNSNGSVQNLYKDKEIKVLNSANEELFSDNHGIDDTTEPESKKKLQGNILAGIKGEISIDDVFNGGIEQEWRKKRKAYKSRKEKMKACSQASTYMELSMKKHQNRSRKCSLSERVVCSSSCDGKLAENCNANSVRAIKDNFNIGKQYTCDGETASKVKKRTSRLEKAKNNRTKPRERQQTNNSISAQKFDPFYTDEVSPKDNKWKKDSPKPRIDKDILNDSEKKSGSHENDGSFSLSLDVSFDSETSSPCINPDIPSTACSESTLSSDKGPPTSHLTPTKSTTESTNSNSPLIEHYFTYHYSPNRSSMCLTPTKSLKRSSSAKSPSSRKCLSGQMDLYSMLTTQGNKKRKLNAGCHDVVTDSQSTTKKPTKRLKRHKLDLSCHRSIKSYMSVSPQKPSSSKKSNIQVTKTEKSPLQSCLEAASQLFNSTLNKLSNLYQKNDSKGDFDRKSSKKLFDNSVLSDSDSDSSSSVKCVKVVNREGFSSSISGTTQDLYDTRTESSHSIVLDDDSDDVDSGKGGSRDNSDGTISCTSFSDGKASNEELEEFCRIQDGAADEGVFFNSKECNSSLTLKPDHKTNENSLDVDLLEQGLQNKATMMSKRGIKVENVTSSPIKHKRIHVRNKEQFDPSRPSCLDSTTTKNCSLLSQSVHTNSQKPTSIKRKDIESCVSSSFAEESSSDESLAPLRKKRRISPLMKTTKHDLSRYNDCSDEDFQCKRKKRESFKLLICQKKQRRAKKKLDDSLFTIDLSSQEL